MHPVGCVPRLGGVRASIGEGTTNGGHKPEQAVTAAIQDSGSTRRSDAKQDGSGMVGQVSDTARGAQTHPGADKAEQPAFRIHREVGGTLMVGIQEGWLPGHSAPRADPILRDSPRASCSERRIPTGEEMVRYVLNER